MNILLLANELRYTCGVTNHLLHLTRGLSENDSKKVYLICGGGNGKNRFDNINVEIIQNEGLWHKERTYLRYLSAVRFLKNFITEKNIDLIHSHSHYAANIAKTAAEKSGVITIQTNHGLLGKEGRIKHFNADKYIVINEHIFDHLLNNKIASADDISFIRCGVPVPDKPPVKNNSNVRVVTASRFVKEKGLDVFINAVAQLPDSVKAKAEFYIAGEGVLEDDLHRLNEFFNTGIVFLGSVDDMYSVLSETDVFVYPSRSDHEGFPAIITEAGANNNLVITSDFSALGDIIENKKTGLVFKQNDFMELSELLKNVIEDPGEYKPMAKKFYDKIKKLYSIDEMITKHSKLYEDCIKID